MIVLGTDEHGTPVTTSEEDATLVLGPPRSGKTSRIVVKTALTHRGPMVLTSSKLDVVAATLAHRLSVGPVWVFSAQECVLHPSVRQATWNPVSSCRDFDQALLHAHAMVGATIRRGEGATEDRFWYRRAERLLAALMHAAGVTDKNLADVAAWVAAGQLREPREILRTRGAGWAMAIVESVEVANDRFRDSVLATASDVVRVYDFSYVRRIAELPAVPVDELLDRDGTLYIVADAQRMDVFSPLVVGMIEEVLRRKFQRSPTAGRTLLCVLDELARISPIQELPGWLAETGSHGVQVLGVLQDLSQARERWGRDVAQGFLTLFTDLVLLRGLRDRELLEDLSTLLGEVTWSPGQGAMNTRPGWSVTDLASPQPGTAIHIRAATARTIALDLPEELR